MKDENGVKIEEKINLLADLDGTLCELDHSGDPNGQRQAINYMMLKTVSGEMIALPICEYCEYELNKGVNGEDFEWYLLVCIKCGATKWLYKDNCINKYDEQVHFIKSCPNCDFKYSNLETDKIQ